MEDSTLRSNQSFIKKTTIEVEVAKMYGYAFSADNPNYSGNIEYDELFVRSQIAYLNQRFHVQGYLFVNDVLEPLGFQKIPAGQVIGWHSSTDSEIDVTYKVYDLEDMPGAKRIWITINPAGVTVNNI